jgi:hypothetical protein
LDLYPTYHPTGGVKIHQKAWNLLSDDVRVEEARVREEVAVVRVEEARVRA